MDTLFILLAAVIVIASLLLLGSGKSGGSLPVEARPILSKREREALIALEAALPQHRIYPQVAMGALLKPRGGLPAKTRTSVHNRFAKKIIDFVAEDRQSGELLLIEVDDRTHSAAKDKQRDAITAAAGYRTVRVPAGTRLSLEVVRSLVYPGERVPVQQRRSLARSA